MADVFLSYASEDRERARTVANAFEAEGWDVWWDRSLDAGQSFGDEITKAIASASCVVVLWSAASVRSRWVKDEASAGSKRGALVPASLDGTDPPLGYGQIHTAQLDGWDGDTGHPEYQLLRDGVAAMIAGGAQPVATPPRPRRRPGLPRWAISALGGVAGALVLLALLVVTGVLDPSAPVEPTPPAATPYPGIALADRINQALPELACKPWRRSQERGDPHPFDHGVVAACVSSEVPGSDGSHIPELDVYLFGSAGALGAKDLRDAFWGLKILRKGLTMDMPDGELCPAGTCGCPFGVPGEGSYPPGSKRSQRISCGYSGSRPELRWTHGSQLYARIVAEHLPVPPDPSASAGPGSSPVAEAFRSDPRIITLYEWWLANHARIETASQGVVP
jgi:hypothetical protein